MQEVTLIPAIRFPEFHDEWVKKTIKSVSSKITDGTHDTPKPTKEGVPYLTAIHVKDGFIDFENCYFLPQEVHNKIFERCNPEYGDLLMVNIGAGTATSAMVNVDFEFSLKNVALIKPNPDIINNELFAQIQRRNSGRLRHQISAGGAQPFLSLKEIAKLKLSIPTNLSEQQKIASFLTALDERIQLLQKKKAKLEEYKKGVMQQLFSQQIRFKDEHGNDFPDWEEKRLGSLATISKGKQLNRSELTETGEYPCQNGGIDPSGYTHQYNTEANTITISEGGNSCGYVNFMETRFWCGGHCYALINIKNSVVLKFLFQSLKFNQNDLMRLRVGSGLPNIQKGDVSKFKIALPSKAEQIKIASFLTSLDASIESLNKEIEGTTTFKKGLLQKMFV